MFLSLSRWLHPRAAVLHRAGFVDDDVASAHVGLVKHRDRLVGCFVIRHLYEGEPPRALCFAVHWDEHGNNFTGLREMLSQLLFRRAVRDAADEQFRGHATGRTLIMALRPFQES